MKRQIQTIAYTIIILVGISCLRDESTELYDQLQLADSYMATKPEISLQILDSLNLTECNKDHYFALLYAQAKYRNYIKAENDSLINVALNYYSKCEDQSMKSRAYLVASQIYSELGDLEAALRYIHLSAQAMRQSTDNWTKKFYTIRMGMATTGCWKHRFIHRKIWNLIGIRRKSQWYNPNAIPNAWIML